MSITDIFPPSVQAAGKVRIQWVPTIAVPATPTLAEITASAGFDATCYFPSDAFEIGHEQARIDDTRLCDAATRESFGRSTFSLENLSYVYNPVGPKTPLAPGNLAFQTWGAGTAGFFAVRFGLPSAQAIVATQIIDVYAAKFGDQHKPVPVGEDGKFLATQPVSLTRVAFHYAIPAS